VGLLHAHAAGSSIELLSFGTGISFILGHLAFTDDLPDVHVVEVEIVVVARRDVLQWFHTFDASETPHLTISMARDHFPD